MASSGTYFGTPALYGVMKKVELPEQDDREVREPRTAHLWTVFSIRLNIFFQKSALNFSLTKFGKNDDGIVSN